MYQPNVEKMPSNRPLTPAVNQSLTLPATSIRLPAVGRRTLMFKLLRGRSPRFFPNPFTLSRELSSTSDKASASTEVTPTQSLADSSSDSMPLTLPEVNGQSDAPKDCESEPPANLDSVSSTEEETVPSVQNRVDEIFNPPPKKPSPPPKMAEIMLFKRLSLRSSAKRPRERKKPATTTTESPVVKKKTPAPASKTYHAAKKFAKPPPVKKAAPPERKSFRSSMPALNLIKAARKSAPPIMSNRRTPKPAKVTSNASNGKSL